MQKFFYYLGHIVFILWCSVECVYAQQYNASGIVVDKAGAPLAGVSVVIKEGHAGVTTDVKGMFHLANLPANSQLIFSFVGLKTIEESARVGMYIVMEQANIDLSEILVEAAYGSQSRRSITGSISTVKADVFNRRAVTSVLSGLEGMVTGVQVNDAAGQPGFSPQVRIRGFGSVNGSNEPLVVIDGILYATDISDINPADIESISVLKDATSAALYGNLAANGVILVNTRKFHSHDLTFTVSMRQSIYTRGMDDYEVMGSDEFMETMWKGYRNALLTDSPQDYPTLELANAETNASLISGCLGYNIYNATDNELFDENGRLREGVSVRKEYLGDLDWQKPLERNGWRQSYYLNGGMRREKGSFSFSLGYLDENGYTIAADFKRLTARLAAEITPRPWLKAGLSLNATNQKQLYVVQSLTANSNNIFLLSRMMAPIYPVHLHNLETGEYALDKEGRLQYDDGTLYARPQNIGSNIVEVTQKNRQNLEQITVQGMAWLEIKFLKDFIFTVKRGINRTEKRDKKFQNSSVGQAVTFGGNIWQTQIGYENITWQELLQWKHQWGGHMTDILVSHENFKYENDYSRANKIGEIFPEIISLSNFTTLNSLEGYLTDYRRESYLGRIRYNYANRYFWEAAFRRDASSRFHPDHRWGNFWSIGASWVMSDEDFIREFSFVDFLKLRASYGEAGNDQSVSYYAYMPLYTITSVGNNAASIKKSNPATDISWETSATVSMALEARLFQRWNWTIEYFDKHSRNLLFDVNLPLSTGAISNSNKESLAQETRNLGSVSNRGIEFSTDVDVIRNRNWRWNIGLGITRIKNKILTLPKINRRTGILAGNQKLMEGHSIYEWWLPQFVGVDRLTGNALYEIDTDSYSPQPETGEEQIEEGKKPIPGEWCVQIGEKYYTQNTSYARKNWSGNALPKFYGHFSTSLNWRNFSFSALCTYSIGGKVLDNIYQDLMEVGEAPHALHRDLLKSWQRAPEGLSENSPERIDPEGIPAINSSLNIYNNFISSRFLVDASYFSVKNIAMTYSLPAIWSRKLDLGSMDIFLSIDNAATFTARKGLNPQQTFNQTQEHKPVTSRVYSLGLTIKL